MATPADPSAPAPANTGAGTADSNHLRFDEPKFDSAPEGGLDAPRKPSGGDHKGSIYAKPDLENGEEYANLVAYISSYYEGPRRKSVVSMEEQDAAKKKPWWKFWGGSSSGSAEDEGFEVPDDVSLPLKISPLPWRESVVYHGQLTNENLSSGSRPISSKVSRTATSTNDASERASTNWSVSPFAPFGPSTSDIANC